MDISFYALLTVGCLVMLLAMWVCAAANTAKWGPDLTLELPPHLLHEALFGAKSSKKPQTLPFNNSPLPSAPSEKLYDPLLSNEHAMDISDPPIQKFKSHPKLDITKAVKVLPPTYIGNQKMSRPAFSTFKLEQTV